MNSKILKPNYPLLEVSQSSVAKVHEYPFEDLTPGFYLFQQNDWDADVAIRVIVRADVVGNRVTLDFGPGYWPAELKDVPCGDVFIDVSDCYRTPHMDPALRLREPCRGFEHEADGILAGFEQMMRSRDGHVDIITTRRAREEIAQLVRRCGGDPERYKYET